jgi:uncharacterized protein YdaU (DUF1376 family)
MGKLPYFPFYPSDWTNDTNMLPLEVKGAWIDILCAMWWNEKRGEIKGTPEEFAMLLRTTPNRAMEITLMLITKKICAKKDSPNGTITLISRRMAKDEKERENNRLRQKRKYQKDKLTETSRQSKENLTAPSSYSSSYSTSKKNNTRSKSKNLETEKWFQEFWEAYGKKVGREECRKWYKKNVDEMLHLQIMEGLTRWREARAWENDQRELQYRPDPIRFLNKKKYQDEPEKKKLSAKEEEIQRLLYEEVRE